MQKLKLGIVRNGHLAEYTDEKPLGASETFKARSLRFVKRDGSGNFDAIEDGESVIDGYVNFVGTTGSSDGDDKTPIEISCFGSNAVTYEGPIYDGSVDATVTQEDIDKLIGTIAAVKVVSDVQYVDLDSTTSADMILTIVGGSASANTLYVKVNTDVAIANTEANTI